MYKVTKPFTLYGKEYKKGDKVKLSSSLAKKYGDNIKKYEPKRPDKQND